MNPVPGWSRTVGGAVRRAPRRWWRGRRYGVTGLAGATLFFCLSLTPSLLPRGHLVQGVISGILAATGYGLGVLLVWLARQLTERPLPTPGRRTWYALAGAAAVAVTVFLVLGSGWQRQIHRMMGMDPPPRFGFPTVLLVAALVGMGLVGLARLLRTAARHGTRLLGRWVPARTAAVLSGVLVVVLAYGVVNGVLLDRAFSFADRTFRTVNDETSPGTTAPADRYRSGGPGSLVSWASLGNQGRTFVAGGATADQLRGFGGPDPQRPIRVYTGLDSAPDSRERADLAVRELQRTGAFDRRVLCVITTTGTGWVNERAVDPLEYMYHGDTALVATQYSYLPSWISFLVDKERARAAGRDLFNAVYAVWSRMPVGQRPKLLVFGESLGSFGAESAFSGTDDIRNRTDGMLLVGPPNRNGLWTEILADRDDGSPQVLPVYQRGATVRFAAEPADLRQPDTTWGTPRTVYLQHASDPITWWSPRLMVDRPDWLEEPPGRDRLGSVRWFPFVTFWQVTADMAFANSVPAGHGHNYGTAPVAAWADVAAPPGWTPARTAALSALIDDPTGQAGPPG